MIKRTRLITAASGLAAFAIFTGGFVVTAGRAAAPPPDLRVTAINSPGGLCKGNSNRVQATIQNSQMTGVTQPIIVKLNVTHESGVNADYQSTIAGGVGPNGNQPVWFNNVNLPVYTPYKPYKFTVTVDPTNNIVETVETNNSLSADKSTSCAPLVVKVYESGTWQGGQGQWIQGATVTLSQQNNSTFAPKTGVTGGDGSVLFQGLPIGKTYVFTASKSGCKQVNSGSNQSTGYYTLSQADATRYVALDCP